MEKDNPRSGTVRASTAFQNLQSTTDTLWSKLAPFGLPETSRRIGFVAPEAGAGTTTVASCAAIGLALHLRANVLLVEVNYRTPRLASFMQASPGPGLVGVLSGDTSIEAAVQKTDVVGLSILPAGARARISPGFFATELSTDVITEFSNQYEFVIFDLPPILESPETRSLLWRLDEACVVLKFGETRRETAERAAAEVAGSGVQMIGSILNRHRSDLPRWLASPNVA